MTYDVRCGHGCMFYCVLGHVNAIWGDILFRMKGPEAHSCACCMLGPCWGHLDPSPSHVAMLNDLCWAHIGGLLYQSCPKNHFPKATKTRDSRTKFPFQLKLYHRCLWHPQRYTLRLPRGRISAASEEQTHMHHPGLKFCEWRAVFCWIARWETPVLEDG